MDISRISCSVLFSVVQFLKIDSFVNARHDSIACIAFYVCTFCTWCCAQLKMCDRTIDGIFLTSQSLSWVNVERWAYAKQYEQLFFITSKNIVWISAAHQRWEIKTVCPQRCILINKLSYSHYNTRMKPAVYSIQPA